MTNVIDSSKKPQNVNLVVNDEHLRNAWASIDHPSHSPRPDAGPGGGSRKSTKAAVHVLDVEIEEKTVEDDAADAIREQSLRALDEAEEMEEKRKVRTRVEEALATVSLESLPPSSLAADDGESLPHHPPEEASVSFHKLTWQRLASCLMCEAIALGALSLPKMFATFGMLPGLFVTVGMGLTSIYTSLLVGEVKYRNPQFSDYAELGRMLFGTIGYRIVATMLILLLVLTTGAHVLTGVVAFKAFTGNAWCAVNYALLSALILFALALPKTFHKMAILAYVDFASITLAVLVTIVLSGMESHHKPGGIAATDWHWFLPTEAQSSFWDCVLALTNVVLAYAYVQCLPSFMSELRRPQDYKKAVWSMGGFQTTFYVLTGALLYAFKGSNVKAPALLSLEAPMQKIVFGIALPVIFISGSINSQTAARFLYERIFTVKSPHHYISTTFGKACWSALVLVITLIAWLAAELIPSFESFLGLLAALFSACFTFTLPAIMYLKVLRYTLPRSKTTTAMRLEVAGNVVIFAFGLFVFFVGSASCIVALVREFRIGVSAPFAC